MIQKKKKDFEFARVLQRIFPISQDRLGALKQQLKQEYPDYAEKAEINIEKFKKVTWSEPMEKLERQIDNDETNLRL